MTLALRRYTQGQNVWVANLEPLEAEGVHHVEVHEPGIYCIYPGQGERRSFFTTTPLWVFCGRQHVAHTRAHDLYPYFEVGADSPQSLFVVVGAANLEQAKSKLPTPAP